MVSELRLHSCFCAWSSTRSAPPLWLASPNQIHSQQPSKMAPPTSDQVQLAVLQTLDASGPIADSRSLVVEGQTMSSAQDQILVKAAVDSLLRREVSLFLSSEAIGWKDDCSLRSSWKERGV